MWRISSVKGINTTLINYESYSGISTSNWHLSCNNKFIFLHEKLLTKLCDPYICHIYLINAKICHIFFISMLTYILRITYSIRPRFLQLVFPRVYNFVYLKSRFIIKNSSMNYELYIQKNLLQNSFVLQPFVQICDFILVIDLFKIVQDVWRLELSTNSNIKLLILLSLIKLNPNHVILICFNIIY